MSRPAGEPRVCRLSELEPGETGDFFAVLISRDRAQTRDGKPFFRARFRDADRTATIMIWADGGWFEQCEQVWKEGEFYKLRGRYYENQYGPHLELEKLRPVEPEDAQSGFDPAEFVPTSRFNAAAMWNELTTLARTEIDDSFVRQLTLDLLEQFADTLQNMAAAMYHHHAYRSGYLQHVLSVTRTALFLSRKYGELYPDLQPPLSRSLVVAGAILHDIGKVIELKSLPSGTDYTPAGRLIGHLVLGRDLVRQAAAQIPDFDPEILLRLEHILLSHQGLPEWGSPIPPSTPEALIIHYADDLDARFEMMAQALGTPATGNDVEFTSRDNPLKRRIFRGLADPS